MTYTLKTITWRLKEVRKTVFGEAPTVVGPADVARIFKSLFAGRTTEAFAVAWLDAANKVVGFELITQGILSSSLVHPREVFRGALVQAPVANIILMHNHPSGNPEPSSEDLRVTRQIVEAGKILGIPVHDHVIFADGITSFLERGLL